MIPQTGDMLLTKHKRRVASDALCWWLNSCYSHIVPVVSEGAVLDVTYPHGARLANADKYLQGNRYRVALLRPVTPLTPEQINLWTLEAARISGRGYDLWSYLGFLANRPEIESDDNVNCAEAALMMCHRVGHLAARNYGLISPQSFVEFAGAGVYSMSIIRK